MGDTTWYQQNRAARIRTEQPDAIVINGQLQGWVLGKSAGERVEEYDTGGRLNDFVAVNTWRPDTGNVTARGPVMAVNEEDQTLTIAAIGTPTGQIVVPWTWATIRLPREMADLDDYAARIEQVRNTPIIDLR